MSQSGGLWKHENNEYALKYPRRWNVAAHVVEELKTITYATPPMEEPSKKKKHHLTVQLSVMPTFSFDRKRLRADVEHQFPCLSSAQVAELIPGKGEMTQAKILSHSDGDFLVYCYQKNPIFYESFKRLYPSGTYASLHIVVFVHHPKM